MTSVQVQLGNLVKEYRIKKGLTQFDLAQKLGYSSPQFVSVFERGMAKVPPEVLGQLIVHLELPERKIIKSIVAEFRFEVLAGFKKGKANALKR